MPAATPGPNQCEVVLVGCGAPKRGMGWYHAEQMLKGKCPSAKLCYIVEPWFLGGGTYSSACARERASMEASESRAALTFAQQRVLKCHHVR